ncbi:hypothetical protein Gotur_036056, partial [Gossypium turneri]
MERVLNGSSWVFNNHLLLLQGLKVVDYDSKLISRGGHVYMYVRVKLDVRNPLKRRKKIGLPQKEQVYIRFQYEKLSMANRFGCTGGQQNGGLGAMGKKNNGVEADDNPVEIVDGKKRPGTTLRQTMGSMYTMKKHIYDEDHGYLNHALMKGLNHIDADFW